MSLLCVIRNLPRCAQKKLAEEFGMSQSTVNMLLTEKRIPTKEKDVKMMLEAERLAAINFFRFRMNFNMEDHITLKKDRAVSGELQPILPEQAKKW